MSLLPSTLLLLAGSVAAVPCNYYEAFTFGDLETGCRKCRCDEVGSLSPHCNGTTGECYCRRGHTGRRCNECEQGGWRERNEQPCTDCGCDSTGSEDGAVCDSLTGQCRCLPGYASRTCGECKTGYIRSSAGYCEVCEECSRRVLGRVDRARNTLQTLNTEPAHQFLARTTARLTQLHHRARKVMHTASRQIASLSSYPSLPEETLPLPPSLTARSDGVLARAMSEEAALAGLVAGVGRAHQLKNLHLRSAYYVYDYARKKLPAVLEETDITPRQLAAFKQQVKMLRGNSVRSGEVASTAATEISVLHDRTVQLFSHSHNLDTQVLNATRSLEELRLLVEQISLSLAGAVDLDTFKSNGSHLLKPALVHEEGFLVRAEVLARRIVEISLRIRSDSPSTEDLSLLMVDVETLVNRSDAQRRALPSLAPAPSALCPSTFRLISSVHEMFLQNVFRPPFVRGVEELRALLSHTSSLTERRSGGRRTHLLNRVHRARRKLHGKLRGLEQAGEVCESRVEQVETLTERVRSSVARVRSHLSHISPGREMEILKQKLNNLTVRRATVRSLDREVLGSLNRLRNKIETFKSRVVEAEKVSFGRKDWVRFGLSGVEPVNISLSFKADRAPGPILAIGEKEAVEERLVVTVHRKHLSVTCFQPITTELYTVCADASDPFSPCFTKMGQLEAHEWMDPMATLDPHQTTALQLTVGYGEVRLRSFQDSAPPLDLEVTCSVRPELLTLARGSFVGCLSNLRIDGLPRPLRAADRTVGQPGPCGQPAREDRGTGSCGPGYLTLESETMVERPEGQPFRLLLTPPSAGRPRTLLLTVGPLRLSLVRGQIKATCHGISVKLLGTHETEAFQLSLETYLNYVSVRSGGELRKLPCVVRRGDFLTLGKQSNSLGGCVKPLL